RNGNGVLDPGEDLNGDGILNDGGMGPGHGPLINEDRNHDSVLDDRFFILANEDVNGNGVCDPGEDLNGDGICGHNSIFADENGRSDTFYPYGTWRPAPGGVIVASVAWNGKAYDLSAINTPTRPLTAADGRQFRVVDASRVERLVPRT